MNPPHTVNRSLMHRGHTWFAALASLACLAMSKGEENKPDKITADTPVKFQELDHYKDLWEKSLFTSRALPKPPATGPSFADGLTLVGIYEINGQKMAVVMDKASSQVLEVSSTPDKNSGMQMLELDAGSTPYKARVHIQRGSETGWVGMADAMLSGPKSPEIRQGQLPSQAPGPVPPPAAEPIPIHAQTPPQVPNITTPSSSSAPAPAVNSGDAPLPPS
ncbi:MAG: hypothetical protein WCN98_00305 [Verrucomicrobiaceae bacterium]